MSGPRVILLLTGLGFGGFGLAYAFWPLPMAALAGLPLPTPTARIDFTATYGGLQLGFGLFLWMSAGRPGWTEPGLWAATAALAGVGLTRALGVVAAGAFPAPVMVAGLLIELATALLNGIALRQWRRAGVPGGR